MVVEAFGCLRVKAACIVEVVACCCGMDSAACCLLPCLVVSCELFLLMLITYKLWLVLHAKGGGVVQYWNNVVFIRCKTINDGYCHVPASLQACAAQK
jgi:hypothetical protein